VSVRKPSIPIYPTSDRTLNSTLTAIKENIEIINGSRASIGPLTQLPATATPDEVITKLNQIIARLNFTGQ